jgi:hypothetical protein
MNQSQAEAAVNHLREALKGMFPDIDIEVRELDRDEAEDTIAHLESPGYMPTILDVLTLPLTSPQKLALVGLFASDGQRMNNERAAFLSGVEVAEWREAMLELAALGYVVKDGIRMIVNLDRIAANVRALPGFGCPCGNEDCEG